MSTSTNTNFNIELAEMERYQGLVHGLQSNGRFNLEFSTNAN